MQHYRKIIVVLCIVIQCYAMQEHSIQPNVHTLFHPDDLAFIMETITQGIKASYLATELSNSYEYNHKDPLLEQKIAKLIVLKDAADKTLLEINNKLNAKQREYARLLYTEQENYIIAQCDKETTEYELKIRKKSLDSIMSLNSTYAYERPAKCQENIVDLYTIKFFKLQYLSSKSADQHIDSLLHSNSYILFTHYLQSTEDVMFLENELIRFYNQQPDHIKVNYDILEKTIKWYIEACKKINYYEKNLSSIQEAIQQCENERNRENRIEKRNLQSAKAIFHNKLDLIKKEQNEHCEAINRIKNILTKQYNSPKFISETPSTSISNDLIKPN